MHPMLERLQQDHVNYSRLMNLLDRQVKHLEHGERTDMLVMRDIMRYMMNYPDVFHHPYEELLFRQMQNKNLPDEAAETIQSLHREHVQLAELSEELDESLEAAVSGSIVSREKLINDANAYLNLMREHVRTEERVVFPLIDQTLSTAEWVLLESRGGKVEDPLFGPVIAEEYRRLYDGVLDASGSTH